MSGSENSFPLEESASSARHHARVLHPDHTAANPAERSPEPAILVCAPMPPHTPLYIVGNVARFLDYGPGDILNNAAFWTDTISAEDLPQLFSGFFHVFTRGYHIYEYHFRQKDGTVKKLLLEIRLRRKRNRGARTIAAFLRDPVDPWGACSFDGPGAGDAGNEDGIAHVTIDSRHRIRAASRSMEAICGLPPKQLAGRCALDFVPGDYIHLANDVFNRIVNQGHQTVRFWYAMNHGDGSLRFVAVEADGINEGAGKRVMTMKYRDITSLVTLDEHIRIRQASLVQSGLPSKATAGATADAGDPFDRLTRREREILSLTVEGLSSTLIGERLSISPRTVEAHRSHIMKKLGVSSQPQLIRYIIGRVTIFAND